MIWDVAAGVIIGGVALGLVWTGISVAGENYQPGDEHMASYGYLMVAIGLGIAAFTLFKAFYR